MLEINEAYLTARARVERCDLEETLLLRLAVEEYLRAVDEVDLESVVQSGLKSMSDSMAFPAQSD